MTTYQARIERDGDDFVLVFPAEVLEALNAKIGDEIMWQVEPDGTVTITPTFGEHSITANIAKSIEQLERK